MSKSYQPLYPIHFQGWRVLLVSDNTYHELNMKSYGGIENVTTIDIKNIYNEVEKCKKEIGINNVWYIYILKCSDGSLYTGITKDVNKRLQKHNSGKGSKYVASKLPAKLLYSKWIGSKSEASKEERRIKKLSRKQKLKLINEDVDTD